MFPNKKIGTNKAQIWGVDLIIAIIIALTAIILIFQYTLDISKFQKGELDRVIVDGKAISDSLISEGYPNNWGLSNVKRIGITNGVYRLNEKKLSNFSYLATNSYYNTKSLFGIKSDYYIFFVDKSGDLLNISGVVGVGKININSTNVKEIENPEKLIKIDRFMIYNSNIIKMVVYVWH